jgi:hypothetical protein
MGSCGALRPLVVVAYPCVAGILDAFLVAGDVAKVDTSCLAKTPGLSFALKPEELMERGP